MVSKFVADARAWCTEGRSFWPRFFLWLWAFSCLYKIFRHQESFGIWGGINFGIHELGHPLFRIFGEFMGIAGGSIAQIAAPLVGVWQFIRQRDYFAAAFCFLWLGESFYNLSFYIADASLQELPLVSPFGGGDGDITHDWNYLLNRLGLLKYDLFLGALCRWTGFISVLVFVIAGYLLINEIYKARRAD